MLVAVELHFENESVFVQAMEDDSLWVVSDQIFRETEHHAVEHLNTRVPWMYALDRPLL